MRFAVVAVGTRDVKLVGHLFARAVEVILVGDGVGVDTRRDVVFVENNIVRERLVVHELNSFALGNGDGVRLLFHSRRTQQTPHVSHRVIECVPHVRIHVAPSRARTSHIMVRDYTIIRHSRMT